MDIKTTEIVEKVRIHYGAKEHKAVLDYCSAMGYHIARCQPVMDGRSGKYNGISVIEAEKPYDPLSPMLGDSGGLNDET